MKAVVLLAVLLPLFAHSQSIVLLDRDFKKPVSHTEALRRDQLSGRWFPLYAADIDTVIKHIEMLARSLNNGLPPAENNQLIAAGHSIITQTKQGSGFHPTYMISISTRCGDVGATVNLVKGGQSPRKAVQALYLFLDYLKNNRHLIK